MPFDTGEGGMEGGGNCSEPEAKLDSGLSRDKNYLPVLHPERRERKYLGSFLLGAPVFYTRNML